jgi:uncharacterized repeat protein (TIGR02543 family)
MSFQRRLNEGESIEIEGTTYVVLNRKPSGGLPGMPLSTTYKLREVDNTKVIYKTFFDPPFADQLPSTDVWAGQKYVNSNHDDFSDYGPRNTNDDTRDYSKTDKVIVSHEMPKYAIYYFLNGGTNSILNPSRYDGKTEITLQAPQKTGFTFNGWFDNESFIGNPITIIEANSTKNKRFYAKWTEIP